MSEPEDTHTKYNIGDFVSCSYDFYNFFSSWYEERGLTLPHHGVVVDIIYDDVWYLEVVYHVYCLDGQYRFFLEDELDLVDNFLTEDG